MLAETLPERKPAAGEEAACEEDVEAMAVKSEGLGEIVRRRREVGRRRTMENEPQTSLPRLVHFLETGSTGSIRPATNVVDGMLLASAESAPRLMNALRRPLQGQDRAITGQGSR